MKRCGRLAWRPELRGKPGGIFLLAGAVVCLLLAYAAWDKCRSPIHALVVSQALGYGVNPQTGELYLMDTFVAGKKTGVFVELTSPVQPDPDCRVQYVRLRHDDDVEEDRLCPKAATGAVTRLEFQPRNGRKPEDWFPGAYTLTAVIGSDSASREVFFKDTGKLRVLVVPIQGQYGKEIVSPDPAWKQAGQFAQTVFPLAENALEWIPYQSGDEASLLGLLGTDYDLDSDTGRYRVAEELAELQDSSAPYALIIGFVAQNMAQEHEGEMKRSLTGFTFGGNTIVISLADGAVPVTVAHEISHFFSVGDEYEDGSLNPGVNMPPYGMHGYHFTSFESVQGKDKYIVAPPDEKFGTGTYIAEWQLPYNAETGKTLGARSSYMGLSGLEEDAYWITPQIWEHLYKCFPLHNKNEISQDL